MVVDHQGVKEMNSNKTIYYLTDPAINSFERCFGNTDMGEQGILSCLYSYSLTKQPTFEKDDNDSKMVTN